MYKSGKLWLVTGLIFIGGVSGVSLHSIAADKLTDLSTSIKGGGNRASFEKQTYQLVGGEKENLSGDSSIVSDSESDGWFNANGAAVENEDGSFKLVSNTKDEAGQAIFDGHMDMSSKWSIKGSFNFSDTWGYGKQGWTVGDGAGIVISGATPAELAKGGSGNAFGIGGVGNSIVAALDTYVNTGTDRGTAGNGMAYTVPADETLPTGENNPGTISKVSLTNSNRVLDPGKSVSDGSTINSRGGQASNDNSAQSVIKFMSSNATGSIISNNIGLKAYAPSTGRDSLTSTTGEQYVASWEPNGTVTTDGEIQGTLSVTFYGNSMYANGFTISTIYNAPTSATIGMTASNGNRTGEVTGTVNSVTGTLKKADVDVKYVGLPDSKKIDDSIITANIGQTLTASEFGNDNSDIDLITPKVEGYRVSKVYGLDSDEVNPDTGKDHITVEYIPEELFVDDQTAQIGRDAVFYVPGYNDSDSSSVTWYDASTGEVVASDDNKLTINNVNENQDGTKYYAVVTTLDERNQQVETFTTNTATLHVIEKNTAWITTDFLDSDGNNLAPSIITDAMVGQNLTIPTPLEFDGKILDATRSSIEVTDPDGTTELTLEQWIKIINNFPGGTHLKFR